MRARIVSLSWQGLRTAKIAEELGCHPKTVRKRLHRFNAEGINGLGDRSGAGRKPRITEEERSKVIALVANDPPGKLLTGSDGVLGVEDESKAAYWTLDALAEATREIGIEISRSQVRHILLAQGGALVPDATVGREHRSGVHPKRSKIVRLYTDPPPDSTVVCVGEEFLAENLSQRRPAPHVGISSASV